MEQLDDKQLEKAAGGEGEEITLSKYDYCHFNPSKWSIKQVFGPGTSCTPGAENRCMSCKHFSITNPKTEEGVCKQM